MKKTLLLLHGALGSRAQFDQLEIDLAGQFDVHSFEFSGHGHATTIDAMSIEHFAHELITYIVLKFNKPVEIFGYSMGGYVALYAASQHPGLFSKITTLGTKFAWSKEQAEKEVKMIQPEVIKEKIPQFGEYLSTIQYPTNWEENMIQTQGLMLKLGSNPLLTADVLAKVACPVKLNLGSKDHMVTKDETIAVKHDLLHAEFTLLEDVPHPIHLIPTKVLHDLIV